jgi:CRISPR-associated protein Cmr1
MERIEATYRVVTPMSMSGANQQQGKLRLPNIQSALSMWRQVA